VPVFRYSPISSSITYSDLPTSSIYLPQVSKYLGSLKLHLNSLDLYILSTICKHTLYLDSVIRHIIKHKFPLRDRTTLTRIVRSLYLPDPKSLPIRPDYSLAYLQLTIRYRYSYILYYYLVLD
jgi:hypothetical protein